MHKKSVFPFVLLFLSVAGLIVAAVLAKTGIKLSSEVIVFDEKNHDKLPVNVTFNKNLEKRWFDEDRTLMGAQFDGIIFNNMKFTAVKDWTVMIDVPGGCRLDPNPWNGEFILTSEELMIHQPHQGDKSLIGKESYYICQPQTQRTFGCIMYAPSDFDPQKSNISISYTPFVYPQLIPGFWAGVIFFFTLFVIMVTSLSVSAFRKKEMIQQEKQNKEFIEATLRTFANTIEAKDQYTKGHSERVSIYSREIARRMKMSPFEQETVYHAAILHDVGKIGVSDAILNKPGPLTPEERKIMQSHAELGSRILEGFTYIPDVATIVRHHHERYDGTGYPYGLSGEKIPLYSRIICVADCFDAMTSDRCYRRKLGIETVKHELEVCSGSQFDPAIVSVFITMINDGFAPIDKY